MADPARQLPANDPIVSALARLLAHLARVRAAERAAANDTTPPPAVASTPR